MPDYTGAAAWQDTIKSLSSGLFPDPSKQAHAYYYGTEARKALLESNKLIDQQGWKNRFMQMQPGLGLPAPASPTWSQPELPGSAPIVNSPANLPMSSIIGATPAQAVAATPALAAPLMQGTPPPVSPPSAVSPPAPNTTGSDGSVPSNDPVSGVIHPGSVTAPNGGPKNSGPAAPNGSPAPMAFDPQTYVAVATASGMDAATAQANAQAYALNGYQRGIFDKGNLNVALSALGQSAPAVADTQADAAVKGHELSAGAQRYTADQHLAGTLGSARIREAEAARQFDKTPKPIIGPDGTPVYAPQIETAGKRVYEPTVAVEKQRQTGAYGTYTRPEAPLQPFVTTAEDAAAKGYIPEAKTTDQVGADLQRAWQTEQDPARKQQLYELMMRNAGLPKGPVAAKEADEQKQVNYRSLQTMYPQPDKARPLGGGEWGVTEPAALTPEAEAAVAERTSQLRTSGTMQQRTDPTAARDDAIRQLQKEGALYTPEEVNQLRQKNWRDLRGSDIRLQDYTPIGKPTSPHMMIGLKNKPATGGGGGGGAPAGAKYLGDAPPNTPDGPMTLRGSGQHVVVRGGKVYDK